MKITWAKRPTIAPSFAKFVTGEYFSGKNQIVCFNFVVWILSSVIKREKKKREKKEKKNTKDEVEYRRAKKVS